MATPFATASDLAIRLKVPLWTGGALDQVNTHLADASDDLRGEIGWQVYPPATVTITAQPGSDGHIYLQGSPIGAVTSVVSGGAALAVSEYELHNSALHVHVADLVSVTYTVGYAAPPAELVKWTCVLAAQSLARAASENLGATPSSEALGTDYRVSYSDSQQSGDLPIPERVLQRLRSVYGQAVHVT